MSRVLAFIVVGGGVLLSSWASPGNLGASLRCADSECMVSAGASPLSLLVAVALLIFLLAFRSKAQKPDDNSVVGVFRRFGAFLLDFSAVMTIAAPLGAIPILLAEYLYAGSFQWSFERLHSRPTDTVLILPGVICIFLALYSYFAVSPRKGRQTIGQYVLGYQVVPTNSTQAPSFGKRAVLSFIGLCAWPVSVILALKHERKDFWWDAASNSKALRVGS